jgi:hypothetical protein
MLTKLIDPITEPTRPRAYYWPRSQCHSRIFLFLIFAFIKKLLRPKRLTISAFIITKEFPVFNLYQDCLGPCISDLKPLNSAKL